MYRLLTLTILLAALGCADEPTSPPAAQQIPDENTATAELPVGLDVTPNDVPHEYPEMAGVVRLLVRASERESEGKFQDALAVTNQAVAIDPNSPNANEMKTRLEELLRRIQISPQFNERTGASMVAQRTNP